MASRGMAALICLLLPALCAPVTAFAREGGPDGMGPTSEYSVRARPLVDAGLRYLASVQNEDHSFCAEPGETLTRAPLAVTALATLAFMASGSTMGRGPYREQVRTGIEYLLSHTREKPAPSDRASADDAVTPIYFTVDSDSTSRMHGHGYATLAVAQAYGTLSPDPTYRDGAADKAREDRMRLRRALVGAVRLIERSQSTPGGWYYDPYSLDHEGSVTVTMVQALRAARNVGIAVDKGVIDRAIRYLHDSQSETGGFKYHLNHHRTSWALTAAAVATLNASGTYDSEVIDKGIDFMLMRDPLLNPDSWSEDSSFPYYGRLYAAQAYYVYRDPEVYRRWQAVLLDDMESRQNKATGAFRGEEYGKVYATAVSCLLLQLPYQYLPIFQK